MRQEDGDQLDPELSGLDKSVRTIQKFIMLCNEEAMDSLLITRKPGYVEAGMGKNLTHFGAFL